MPRFHATPYDVSRAGFYFETFEEFEEKYKANLPCEEYEIQFIDGDGDAASCHFEMKLFEAMKVHQGNIETYLDALDDCFSLSNAEKAGIIYLLEQGNDFDDAKNKCGEVVRHVGTVLDYAYEYVDDCIFDKNTPDVLRTYFDYKAFARDLQLSGDVCEFKFDGQSYVMDSTL